MQELLDLVDYRRRVAELYAEVRRRGVGPEAWRRWVATRTDLLTTHPQSPLGHRERSDPDVVRFFDYDPTWCVVGAVEALSTPAPPIAAEGSTFRPIATVTFEREGSRHELTLLWLDGYGGGLFLPFADPTNGLTTYGGGRYLLDGAKSADLGSPGPDQLVLDFNFAYHPSCMWDSTWACPLAPATNRLTVDVEAGEQRPPDGGGGRGAQPGRRPPPP